MTKLINERDVWHTVKLILNQSNVATIPGAVSEGHARENFDISNIALGADETTRIDALAGNRRLVNPGLAPNCDVA